MSTVVDAKARGDRQRRGLSLSRWKLLRLRDHRLGKAGPKAVVVGLYERRRVKNETRCAGQWQCVGAGMLGLGLATIHRTTLGLRGRRRRARWGMAAVAIVTGRG